MGREWEEKSKRISSGSEEKRGSQFGKDGTPYANKRRVTRTIQVGEGSR